MLVPYASLCDLCGKRGQEYCAYAHCRVCGIDVCDECSVDPEPEDGAATCKVCTVVSWLPEFLGNLDGLYKASCNAKKWGCPKSEASCYVQMAQQIPDGWQFRFVNDAVVLYQPEEQT